VNDLDDVGLLAAGDPGGMLGAAAALGDQCSKGYELGLKASGLPDAEGIASIALCGMGGSAVGGDVVRGLFASRLGVPIEVVRNPVLPEFCETHSLVVCTSYSGNTAETLSAFEEAARRGCRLIVVTSGGRIESRALELEVPVVKVPSGLQPRAALGYLTLGLIGALESMGVIPHLASEVSESVEVLGRLASELGPESAANRAKVLAAWIGNRTPVIWGADGLGAVAAMRFKTQFNENGKVPAWWSAMSELDHNEIAAWGAGTGEKFFLIVLRHKGEHPSISPRFALSIALAKESGMESEEIWAEGSSPLARFLSLVSYGDFTSVYSALSRGVDPTPVDVIERLKHELG
jgi:glucose/mannose-6-phosphate isomerase